MSDFIDRKAAIAAVDFGITYVKAFKRNGKGEAVRLFLKENEALLRAIERLKALPSTDAVPVVCCKDCKHWDERLGEKYCWEMYFNQDDPDFYCGYAERR